MQFVPFVRVRFVVAVVAARRRCRLRGDEVHAALGTAARSGLPDFRVHRAGVIHGRGLKPSSHWKVKWGAAGVRRKGQGQVPRLSP